MYFKYSPDDLNKASRKLESNKSISKDEYYTMKYFASFNNEHQQKAYDLFATLKKLEWEPCNYFPRYEESNDEFYASQGTPLGSDPCYLTTACMVYMADKFDDHCFELTTLRRFRDEYMKVKYPQDVKEYYRIAPGLVEKINARPDAKDIYNKIYNDLILPAIQAYENGQLEETQRIYKSYTQRLISTYAQEVK